ncbi:hypothetical protein ARMGADRAFT_537991 [Armillaria gallica]|uniref:Uncharacterized protein n=1 Tax=Armillaria gallica TaxID=47427 RepID=A0A2H3CXJ4_ARMGA|nr:hypothetical protein ARMGADRAFT_537991 [Armillaria gallica]
MVAIPGMPLPRNDIVGCLPNPPKPPRALNSKFASDGRHTSSRPSSSRLYPISTC